ncbi:hypothetical protein AQJ27_36760 [Streptomyces olivochromogenes]|nr:hypothetical protein AQJ27_36760 [Streptomyces olivochromogenes]
MAHGSAATSTAPAAGELVCAADTLTPTLKRRLPLWPTPTQDEPPGSPIITASGRIRSTR